VDGPEIAKIRFLIGGIVSLLSIALLSTSQLIRRFSGFYRATVVAAFVPPE